MPHTDADGGRTIDVVCACGCASVTRIRLDPDAPGRERAVMRADRIRLYDIIDRITEESDEYRKLMDMARTEDASRFAAIVARIIEMGAAGLCTAEDVRRELGAAGWPSGPHRGPTTPRTCAGSASWRRRCAG